MGPGTRRQFSQDFKLAVVKLIKERGASVVTCPVSSSPPFVARLKLSLQRAHLETTRSVVRLRCGGRRDRPVRQAPAGACGPK